jgi:predicted PurR-regulated permease PerM
LLAPLVRRLARAGVPPALSAGMILVGLVATAVVGVGLLYEPVLEWARDLPRGLEQAEQKLRSLKTPVEEMSDATKSVESMTALESEKGDLQVTVRRPSLLATVASSAWNLAVTAFLSAVLLFFLLANEDSLMRKAASLPRRFSQRRLLVTTGRRIQEQVSRYLRVITAINALLGCAVGVAMWLLDMPNPLLWGAMAAFLNFVPYLGALVGIGIVGLVAFLTFETPLQMLAPPLVYWALNLVEGFLVSPAVVGRVMTISSAALFVWLVLWTFLWQVPGALMAMPLLVIAKILCEEVPALRPVDRLLSR